jgi:succinate-semialdehyde dehydrogenase/glutarate-semialdehyde dehydrogenase
MQAGVADEFTRRLTERMAATTVGRGTETGVEVAPSWTRPAAAQ